MKRELTHFQARNCYKKKRNGVTYYVGKGSDKDTDANYRRAWAEWETKLGEIVKAEAEQRRQNDSTINPDGTPKGWYTAEQIASATAAHQAAGHFTAAGGDDDRFIDRPTETARWIDMDRRSAARAAATKVYTVGQMVTKFLDSKRQQAKTEQRSVGRFANIESYLEHFKLFVGKETVITTIDAITLSDYYTKQLEAIDADEITCWAGRDRLQIARQFVRWAFEMGVMDLPRNTDSKNLVISCTPGKVKPMPAKELRRRIKAATGRLKLELLLMANCGFYQVDCADLLHTEIDWKAGTITRKRSKKMKGKEENLPTVTWHLWPTTLELLRTNANNDGANVLTTRNGLATVRDSINSDGKASRTDATALAYSKLQDAIEGERWPLKSIRKTSATMIGANKDYARYVQHFLGQAPESVADLHYVKPSEEEMKKLCQWLGDELKLDNMKDIEQDAKKDA